MTRESYCRYKEGDIVQIRPDLSVAERYRMPNGTADYGFVPSITLWEIDEDRLDYRGRSATITEIFDCRYILDVDGGNYWWCDDMFVDEDDLQVNKEVCEQELASLLCL